MLSTWNAENINQVGPSQRGLGGGKSFKPLGDAGSSENPPSASGKGILQRKLKPLGSYSENAPPSAAKGKAAGGGRGLGGLPPNSSAKKQPRRALGDISNAGNGPPPAATNNAPSKLSGKQQLLTPGLKFTVHSDSNKAAGGAVRPRGAGSRVVASGSGKNVVGSNGRVDDIELPLGRTGDEEEVLVERRAEERAAEKFARPHRSSAVRSSRSRSQSTSSSFPKASSSSHSRSKGRFGRDITNTAAAGANTVAAASGVLEKSFDSAIKGIVRADFEEREKEISGDDKNKNKERAEASRAVLEDDSALDLDMEAVTMALEALESTPLDLVDDGFLTRDLDDLSFA
ncbi:expressed unknown protein [Ectocarpus siliculosus]|uniref:Uncharacterized protein n=1 Tax=Ectocarpus siliculosus TaxID=2880 RepID=D7FJ54_ECTSI|nr:expressed unknown protein [Ectocarpus siliculosus]|eukprot:CBJ28964.1 expressed unknown protein [Ectocarpus siliculosus]